MRTIADGGREGHLVSVRCQHLSNIRGLHVLSLHSCSSWVRFTDVGIETKRVKLFAQDNKL